MAGFGLFRVFARPHRNRIDRSAETAKTANTLVIGGDGEGGEIPTRSIGQWPDRR